MPDAYSANLRATLNNNFADGDWGEIGAAYPALTAHIDAQAERIAELEAENARLREGLETLKQWSNGYPVNRFGEPNLAAVKKLLSDANMLVQMDRMHASWARYLAEYVGGVVDAALKDTAQ